MKRTLILYLVGLLSLGCHAVTSPDTGGTEKTVAALEQRWLQSQKTNNPDLVAPLLADKFVNTGSDGKVESEAESLARAKATKYDSAGGFEASGIWRHGHRGGRLLQVQAWRRRESLSMHASAGLIRR